MSRAAGIGVAVVILAIGAWYVVYLPRFETYRYPSFESIANIEVVSIARAQLDHLYFAPRLPTRYHLRRDDYQLSIAVDPTSYRPNVVISLMNSGAAKLVPRPERTIGIGRARPCGSYGNLSSLGDSFEFRWTICGENSFSTERVIAFDVVRDGEKLSEENLLFDLKPGGFYWLRDSL